MRSGASTLKSRSKSLGSWQSPREAPMLWEINPKLSSLSSWKGLSPGVHPLGFTVLGAGRTIVKCHVWVFLFNIQNWSTERRLERNMVQSLFQPSKFPNFSVFWRRIPEVLTQLGKDDLWDLVKTWLGQIWAFAWRGMLQYGSFLQVHPILCWDLRRVPYRQWFSTCVTPFRQMTKSMASQDVLERSKAVKSDWELEKSGIYSHFPMSYKRGWERDFYVGGC